MSIIPRITPTAQRSFSDHGCQDPGLFVLHGAFGIDQDGKTSLMGGTDHGHLGAQILEHPDFSVSSG